MRGYKEKGNINTQLELAILNQIDRYSLAIDAIDRVPKLQAIGAHTREHLKNMQIECLKHARTYGIDRTRDSELEVAVLITAPVS